MNVEVVKKKVLKKFSQSAKIMANIITREYTITKKKREWGVISFHKTFNNSQLYKI